MKIFGKVFLIALLILAVPFTYILVANTISDNNSRPLAEKMLSMSDQDRQQHFNNWKKDKTSYMSEDEVNKILSFRIHLPQKGFSVLKGIYVTSPTTPDETQVHVLYDDEINGIYLQIQKNSTQPNYEDSIKSDEELKKSGVFKGDKIPQIVTINGQAGIGNEPGYNIVKGEKHPRPGFVSWWDNGLIYTIYGTTGDKGTTLEELVKMADSVYLK